MEQLCSHLSFYMEFYILVFFPKFVEAVQVSLKSGKSNRYFTFTFIKMTVKHNSSLNLITGCLYISFSGLHVSVILTTIIMSVRAKEIDKQQIFVAWQFS